jgi:steroid 5-alpha reductase family enzyme
MELSFWRLWLEGFIVVLAFMTLVWAWSVRLKNASIVDPFWGLGFVVAAMWYAFRLPMVSIHQWVLLLMVMVWGFRLFTYLFLRNYGKEEDYRYQQFRKNYGEDRYWWVSFFQVFMLQGVLLAFISVTLLGGLYPKPNGAGQWPVLVLAGLIWLVGFIFETVGDWQMYRFKSDPDNKGKIMDRGLWKYTRHPNYFGDTMVWWGYALFAVYNGYWYTLAGTLVMTWLIVNISGVAMLERNLIRRRPGYEEYIRKTPAFFPWFPSQK